MGAEPTAGGGGMDKRCCGMGRDELNAVTNVGGIGAATVKGAGVIDLFFPFGSQSAGSCDSETGRLLRI